MGLLKVGRDTLCVCVATVTLAACAVSQSTPAPTSGSVENATTGNIFWNKHRLGLTYPSQMHEQAILTYWARDGYYTVPVSCQNGGKISAKPHHTSGNPKRYMHVVYWFKARTEGPDHCSFTAVLNNTGSPPIAVIHLDIIK